jgi:hypothetical protein
VFFFRTATSLLSPPANITDQVLPMADVELDVGDEGDSGTHQNPMNRNPVGKNQYKNCREWADIQFKSNSASLSLFQLEKMILASKKHSPLIITKELQMLNSSGAFWLRMDSKSGRVNVSCSFQTRTSFYS